VDRNVAGGGVGRSGDKSALGLAHKRRVSLRNVRYWLSAPDPERARPCLSSIATDEIFNW
jgi:hypothetical protein